jgi:uncharacterized protein
MSNSISHSRRWVPSRYNVIAHANQDALVVYNSYTGAIAHFSKIEKPEVLELLKTSGVEGELTDTLSHLHELGFMVSDQVDEDQRALYLHQSLHRTDVMHLIILPTEACNFRCVYCYEAFSRGAMTDNTKEGLKKYVQVKAASLQHLAISWFGGEPLLAPDIIGELTQSFLETADQQGFTYAADITTNGYHLTEALFKQLLSWKINRFMITLDGPESVHDARRQLHDSGKTFARILENLKEIKKLSDTFEVHLRVNFDESNLHAIEELIILLSEVFSGDNRFQLFFRPIGRWGGANDDCLSVCDRRTADSKIWEFNKSGLNHGLRMSSFVENALLPTGSVCYAAKPHSLVIGSNGKLYKCTIALEEDFNQLGQLHSDGSIDLDYDKMALWTTSGEEKDELCRSCFYRPACQGNHCPLYRMRTGLRPCPFEKRQIKKALNLIWENHLVSEEV